MPAVLGRRRVTLLPPSAHRALRLHGWLGHRARQSRLEALLGPREAAEVAEVLAAHGGQVVDLLPGDVLYIPPYVFHRMEVLDGGGVAAAVSLWSPSVEPRAARRASAVPMPFEAQWRASDRAVAGAVFVMEVVRRAVAGSAALDAAATYVGDMVAARYARRPPRVASAATPSTCSLSAWHTSAWGEGDGTAAVLADRIVERAGAVAAAFAAIRDTAVREIYVDNWCAALARCSLWAQPRHRRRRLEDVAGWVASADTASAPVDFLEGAARACRTLDSHVLRAGA